MGEGRERSFSSLCCQVQSSFILKYYTFCYYLGFCSAQGNEQMSPCIDSLWKCVLMRNLVSYFLKDFSLSCFKRSLPLSSVLRDAAPAGVLSFCQPWYFSFMCCRICWYLSVLLCVKLEAVDLRSFCSHCRQSFNFIVDIVEATKFPLCTLYCRQVLS